LLAFPFALRFFPASLDETVPQRFDVVGAVFLGVGAGSLMYSFNLLESQGFGPSLVGIWAVSAAFLALFVVRIRKGEQPFVDPALFRDTRFVAGLVIASLVNATRFGTIVLVPILLVDVERTSALVVGVVLFPGALCIAIFSTRAGRWADRIGARRPVLLGTTSILLAIVLTSVMAGLSVAGVAAGMTLYGLGFSLIQSPLVSATSQLLPEGQTGVGLGMFMMIFFLGGAFGVAFTVTAVELQGAGATSWLGLDLGGGAPFSNAILCLLAFGLGALAFVPRVAGTAPEPIPKRSAH
jgi:DHA2 family metal-tetracycline-proton antiporter-like MFS transporter